MASLFDTRHLYRSYFKMALPVVLGMVVTLVYNLADTFFIAQTNDTDLIAGVSLCAPVFTALMAFGNIYGQGGSSLISRLLGKQDGEGAKRVSSFCFYIALATGIVLAVVLTAFNRPVLTLLGADADTLPHAREYYLVLVVCAPIMVLSFIHSSLVRCEGMSTESMIGTVLGAIINIILDPILISAAGMGAMGAAVATVIGYLCSVLYFLWLLRKKSRCLSVKFSLCRIGVGELRQILGVGVTAALSNLMQSLCIIVINQFLLPYGNDKIAAMGIVLKINMIAQLILTGFAFGGVPLFGYLYGARKRMEMKKLVGFCLGFLSAFSLVLTGCFVSVCIAAHGCVCAGRRHDCHRLRDAPLAGGLDGVRWHRTVADGSFSGYRKGRAVLCSVHQPAGRCFCGVAADLHKALCLQRRVDEPGGGGCVQCFHCPGSAAVYQPHEAGDVRKDRAALWLPWMLAAGDEALCPLGTRANSRV